MKRLIKDFRPFLPQTWADWPENVQFKDVLESADANVRKHISAGERYLHRYRAGERVRPICVRERERGFEIVDGDSRCLGWMMLSPAEQEKVVISAQVMSDIAPAKEPFNLLSEEKQSGFWFPDGSYIFVKGALKHHQLFCKLKKQGVINAESLEDLWSMGVVRVHLGVSLEPLTADQRFVLSIQGAQDVVLARIRECADWVGPDGARIFKTRMDIIPLDAVTDEGFFSFIGTLRTGLAWLLLDCPVEVALNHRHAYDAVALTEYEIVAALKKGGIEEWV